MSETIYEIKRSKFIIILMWFLVFIGEAVFGGFSIFGIVSIVREDYKKFDDPNMQLICVSNLFNSLLFDTFSSNIYDS